MNTEVNHVVWWSLLIGGAIGGFCRSLPGGFELPRISHIRRKTIVIPGFLGDMILGPVAALLLLGASAATFDFQTAYDAKGFWGPLISSVVAGLGAVQITQQLVKKQLEDLQDSLVADAEASLLATDSPDKGSGS